MEMPALSQASAIFFALSKLLSESMATSRSLRKSNSLSSLSAAKYVSLAPPSAFSRRTLALGLNHTREESQSQYLSSDKSVTPPVFLTPTSPRLRLRRR